MLFIFFYKTEEKAARGQHPVGGEAEWGLAPEERDSFIPVRSSLQGGQGPQELV